MQQTIFALIFIFSIAAPAAATPKATQHIPSWQEMKCFKNYYRIKKIAGVTYKIEYNCQGEMVSYTKKIEPLVRDFDRTPNQ